MSEVLVEVTMWMVMYLLGSRTMQNLPEYPLGNKVYIYMYVCLETHFHAQVNLKNSGFDSFLYCKVS